MHGKRDQLLYGPSPPEVLEYITDETERFPLLSGTGAMRHRDARSRELLMEFSRDEARHAADFKDVSRPDHRDGSADGPRQSRRRFPPTVMPSSSELWRKAVILSSTAKNLSTPPIRNFGTCFT